MLKALYSRIVFPKQHPYWRNSADNSNTAETRKQATSHFLRRLYSEFLGSLILTFLQAFLRIVWKKGDLSQGEYAIGIGLTTVFTTYALGEVSGAHLNPAITLAFALRKVFPCEWILFYWLAQFTGAILAGAFVRAFYGIDASTGTSQIQPGYSVIAAFWLQLLFAFITYFINLSLAVRGRIVGVQSALAMGAITTTTVLIAAQLSSGNTNIARMVGTAIVNGPWTDVWIYPLSSFAGAILAPLAVHVFATHIRDGEIEKAMGAGREDQV